jgi:hypothetical protein
VSGFASRCRIGLRRRRRASRAYLTPPRILRGGLPDSQHEPGAFEGGSVELVRWLALAALPPEELAGLVDGDRDEPGRMRSRSRNEPIFRQAIGQAAWTAS